MAMNNAVFIVNKNNVFKYWRKRDHPMKFISFRDLRKDTTGLRRDLEANREIALTANRRPIAVMTRVGPDDVEEEILAIRCTRARGALSSMRGRAKTQGLDRLTTDQIDVIVTRTRRERPSRP